MVLYGFQGALIEPPKLQLLANHPGVGGNTLCVEKTPSSASTAQQVSLDMEYVQ